MRSIRCIDDWKVLNTALNRRLADLIKKEKAIVLIGYFWSQTKTKSGFFSIPLPFNDPKRFRLLMEGAGKHLLVAAGWFAEKHKGHVTFGTVFDMPHEQEVLVKFIREHMREISELWGEAA